MPIYIGGVLDEVSQHLIAQLLFLAFQIGKNLCVLPFSDVKKGLICSIFLHPVPNKSRDATQIC